MTVVELAIEDLMDFPLVGVVQLNWGWWVCDSVGDLTSASGLQQQHMEDGVNAGQS